MLVAFVSPSGYGNQVQALLAALFLSTAANQTLVVPPLLTHYASAGLRSDLQGGRCANPAHPKHHKSEDTSLGMFIDRRKRMLVRFSERSFGLACNGSFGPHEHAAVTNDRTWGWFDVATGFNARGYRCTERPLCSTLHATLLRTEPALVASSRCKNGTLEPNQTPSCAESIQIVKTHSASPLCLGPLNDRFYTHLLPK